MRSWSLKYSLTAQPLFGQLALGLPHVFLSGAPSRMFCGTSGRLQNHCSIASVVNDVTKTPPPAVLKPSPYESLAVSAYEQPVLPFTLALQSLLRACERMRVSAARAELRERSGGKRLERGGKEGKGATHLAGTRVPVTSTLSVILQPESLVCSVIWFAASSCTPSRTSLRAYEAG